jgi:hypothetical protein
MRNYLAEIAGRLKNRYFSKLTFIERQLAQSKINQLKSLRHSSDVHRSQAVIEKFIADIGQVARDAPQKQGHKYLHFVFGIKTVEEFPYYAYLAVRTAQAHNPGWKTVFAYVNEPTGPWWTTLKPSLVVVQLDNFSYFMGARFVHYAHKADVVRLLMLRELGGVYLDMDTLTIKPYTGLLEHDFGMAVQAAVNDSAAGLCNAVMWGRPQAKFLLLWLSLYGSFRSRGRDEHWDFHSVRLPGILIRENPQLVTVLHHRSFFYPLWTDVVRILFSENGDRYIPDLDVAYGFHLWNGGIEDTLLGITPDWIQTSKSAYAHYVRQALGMEFRALESAKVQPVQRATEKRTKVQVTSQKGLPQPVLTKAAKGRTIGSGQVSDPVNKSSEGVAVPEITQSVDNEWSKAMSSVV